MPKFMQITSPVFNHQQKIPAKYTCVGENVNPPLHFVDTPSQAKSLVLLVDDPDAPSGSWVHWLVFNIDPKTTKIEENSKPSGNEGTNSFGKSNYGGPCPPSGTHRYFFKLYALDTALAIPSTADAKIVETAMQGHIITHAELIGLFGK